MGGHKVQGRRAGREAGGRERLLDDAVAVEPAGAFAVVIEGVPRALAAEITAEAVDPDDRHRRRARLRRPSARAARRARAVRAAAEVHQAVRRPAHGRDRGHRGRTSPRSAPERGPTTSTPSTDRRDGSARRPRRDARLVGGAPGRRHARLGFVPTMGALHDGHLSLVAIARNRCDDVVVSIFVNPLQFDRAADFDAYPRPIDDDVARCPERRRRRRLRADRRGDVPAGLPDPRRAGRARRVMEGAARPGHFRGVTTVVTKLFGAVRPDVAVFGEKDFQQLAIIRRMTRDLDLGIEIVGAPIVREPDGAGDVQPQRPPLPGRPGRRGLHPPRPRGRRRRGRHRRRRRRALPRPPRRRRRRAAGPLEYVEIFDPATLRPVTTLGSPARIAIAVWFGDVRLIDNRALLAAWARSADLPNGQRENVARARLGDRRRCGAR